MGYVRGDVLWLLTRADDAARLEDASYVLAWVEDRRGMGHECEHTYGHLLSTLGPQVFPLLERRLRQRAGEKWNPLPSYAADCLLRIAQSAPDEVDAVIQHWLADSQTEVQQAGQRVLVHRPQSAALDRLWELHRPVVEALHTEKFDHRRHEAYGIGNRALRRGVADDVAWLLDRIRHADPQQEPVGELAWLLASCVHPAADAAWPHLKSQLIDAVLPEHPRAMIACINRFRDTNELDRLERWAVGTSEQLQNGFAFDALSRLDPDRAVSLIRRVDTMALLMMSRYWLPVMLLQRPDQTRQAIREMIQESDLERRGPVDVYVDQEHRIDVTTLDVILDYLERQLDLVLRDHAAYRQRPILWSTLSVVSKADRPECLERFRTYSGSDLERKLADMACWWSRNNADRGMVHHQLRYSAEVLLKIDGEGLPHVINAELEAPLGHRWQGEGSWAAIRGDDETRRLLVETVQTAMAVPDASTDVRLDAGVAVQSLLNLKHVEDAAALLLEEPSPATFFSPPDEFEPGWVEVPQDLVTSAVAILEDHAPGDTPYGATLVVGMSGQTKAIPFLRSRLRDVAPGSTEARVLLEAYRRCGGGDPADVELLRGFLKGATWGAALNALLTVDRQEALEAFVSTTRHGIGSERWATALWFCQQSDGRNRLLDALVEEALQTRLHFLIGDTLRMLGHSNRADVGDLLREYVNRQTIEGWTGLAAMQGLARHHPEDAIRLAEQAWARWEKSRDQLPLILVEIDAQRGSEALLDRLPDEADVSVISAAGRALRQACRAGARPAIVNRIESMLHSHDVAARLAAAEVAGWCDDVVPRQTLIQIPPQ